MESFLIDVGRRALDRWLTTALLSGLLFVATAATGYVLGFRHALDPGHLVGKLDDAATQLTDHPAAIAVAAVAALLATAVAAALAGLLAGMAERVWLAGRGGRPLTRMGAEIARLGRRIGDYYGGLALRRAWPRLWLLLQRDAREPIIAAADQFHAASSVAGWGLLYLALGAAWPPAVVIGAALVILGWHRAASAINAFSELIEATVDVHQATLAEAFGISLGASGRITQITAPQINERLAKSDIHIADE